MAFALATSLVLLCLVVVHDLLVARRLRRMVETERSARRELATELRTREALAAENAALYRHARREAAAHEDLNAMVSHDLRNPLNVILASVSVLQRVAELEHPAARIRTIAQRIERASTQASRLIDDLLDVASIEAGTLTVATSSHDPAALISETIESQEALTAAKWLNLAAEIEPALPPVDCDRERLGQVFANLIGNAVKFSPPGARITVRAHRAPDGDQIVFEVADQGPGIPVDSRPYVFDRYWHGQRDNPGGRGLGLSIAKGLVEAHRGVIGFETELGTGTTFRFSIPVYASDRQSAPTSASARLRR